MCGQLGDDDGPVVNALQLSQAGALSAWSVGDDRALVCTDITTCQTVTSTPCSPTFSRSVWCSICAQDDTRVSGFICILR
jgi:hypothetical protein